MAHATPTKVPGLFALTARNAGRQVSQENICPKPIRRAKISPRFSKNHLSPTIWLKAQLFSGRIIAIEKDMVVIDAGLKVEGRVALKEFGAKGKDGSLKPGDMVDIYVERIENALGEAVLSRDKARREESWVKLEEKFAKSERVEGTIFNVVKGGFTVDLDGATAFLPRSQVDIRPIRDVITADACSAAVRNPQDGQAPRQHRCLAPFGS